MNAITHLTMKNTLLSAILFCLYFIFACSGGGGGGSDVSTAGGGSGTVAGVSKGQIQSFGSITVNDNKLETVNTLVEMEEVVVTLNDLQKGMVVTVEGDFNSSGNGGNANVIKFADKLEGPIFAIDETTPGLIKILTILGQSVIVENGFTQFDNDNPSFNFASIGLGNVVEVSGFTNANGFIQASFIEQKAVDLVTFLAVRKCIGDANACSLPPFAPVSPLFDGGGAHR